MVTVHKPEHWRILHKESDDNQHMTDSLLELPRVLTWSHDHRPRVEVHMCHMWVQTLPARLRQDLGWSRGWWWWRGGKWRGITLPDLTTTFYLAAALAVKLAERRPEAGLPPHNEMKKGVERAFRKGNILKDKFWEGILWSEHYLVCWTQKTILGDKGHIM